MDDIDIVRLSVPGTLQYRDLVLRAVSSFCRLVRAQSKQEASRAQADEFDDKIVSAVGEAFNNVAIHGYRGRAPGKVELELEVLPNGMSVRLIDTGAVFDPTGAPATAPSSLPESNMGLFIIRSCVDTVSYRGGSPPDVPNVLTLTKHYAPPDLAKAR
ncbi:MAG TPA: ATP-binding protein [Polyangiaceae bacterium]